MAKRSSLTKHHHLRLTSAPGNHTPAAYGVSALRVRTRLRERRPVSVKRHTAHIATRLGVLLFGDVAAIVVCELFSAIAAENSLLGPERIRANYTLKKIVGQYGELFRAMSAS